MRQRVCSFLFLFALVALVALGLRTTGSGQIISSRTAFRFRVLGADTTNPNEGDVYENNSTHLFKGWNGSAWVSFGGGTGTVTSVSVVTANGVSGAVANPTTTPAITLTLGAITPTSVTGLTGAFTPNAAGGTDLGSASLPFANLWIGAAATNNFKITGTATAARVFTLQDTASDTFGMLAATQAFTNKTYNGLTVTSSTGTLTITNGKVASFSNTLTFAGTDSTTMTYPSTSQSIPGLALNNSWTRGQTFTEGTANESILLSTGGSNTGSNAASAFDLSWTLNTTGSPDVWALRVTDTARGATTKLFNIYAGASGTTSEFSLDRSGDATIAGWIQGPNGTATNPTYSFTGATNAGLMDHSSGFIGIAQNGTFRAGAGSTSWSVDGIFGIVAPANFAAGPDTGGGRQAAGFWEFNNGTLGSGGAATVRGSGGTHGENWFYDSKSEQLTLSTSGTTTNTVGNLAPANAIIDSIDYRITTTITTATAFTIKVTGGNVFNSIGTATSSQSTLTAGTTGILVPNVHSDQYNTTATTLTVTTTGTPGAGVIRLTVHYRQPVAPTS